MFSAALTDEHSIVLAIHGICLCNVTLLMMRPPPPHSPHKTPPPQHLHQNNTTSFHHESPLRYQKHRAQADVTGSYWQRERFRAPPCIALSDSRRSSTRESNRSTFSSPRSMRSSPPTSSESPRCGMDRASKHCDKRSPLPTLVARREAHKLQAMKVLQRRKMYETQKDQLEQQSWNMQQAGMMQDNLKSLSLFSYISICLLLPLLLASWDDAGKAVALALVGLGGLSAWAMLMRRLRRRRGADVMVTVDAMKTTNKELKKQYGKVNIDKSESTHAFAVVLAANGETVEQMQDEMADLMDIGNDIQESISRSYDIPDGDSCRFRCRYIANQPQRSTRPNSMPSWKHSARKSNLAADGRPKAPRRYQASLKTLAASPTFSMSLRCRERLRKPCSLTSRVCIASVASLC
jgi:hypothetical protein